MGRTDRDDGGRHEKKVKKQRRKDGDDNNRKRIVDTDTKENEKSRRRQRDHDSDHNVRNHNPKNEHESGNDDDGRDDKKRRRHSTERSRDRDDDRDRHRKRSSDKKSSKRHSRRGDEGSRKKKKRRGDDEFHRSEKKSKKESKSKSHATGESTRDKGLLTSKIKVDKSKLFPLGDVLGHAPERMLDPEQDYFAYHQHFWVYLYREKQTAFNDLNAGQARDIFKEFVTSYNDGKLETVYYNSKGLPLEALDEIKTTGHKWGIHISDRESKSLQILQEGVRKQTEYSKESSSGSTAAAEKLDKMVTPVLQPHDILQKRIPGYEPISKRHLKEQIRNNEEELAGGRKDGRERQIEKRKEFGSKIHGAARDREDAATAPALSDDVIYGNSESDFQSALAAEKKRKMKQEEQKKARIAELKAKEEENQKAMLQMLGLADKIKPGEKFQIQPRNDS